MLKPGDQVAWLHDTFYNNSYRVTVQCIHVTLMNTLNRSSSSALDLHYGNTMETRHSERGLIANPSALFHECGDNTISHQTAQVTSRTVLCSETSLYASTGCNWKAVLQMKKFNMILTSNIVLLQEV